MREIRMLRLMWRGLETELRITLAGHEGGNSGHRQGEAPLSPRPTASWENCHVERVIGSIRRECTDHIIPFGRRHLLRVLREYVGYYNTSRPHHALDRNAPMPRRVEAVGDVRAKPVLGGLHHRYFRAA